MGLRNCVLPPAGLENLMSHRAMDTEGLASEMENN